MAYPLLLHAKHQDAPPLYQAVGEWMVPWRFGSFDEEYQTLRRRAGLLDYSTQALIEVRGADRAGFLHNLLTNDIKRLSAGTGCRAALVTANAKLVADLVVLADADALWLMCDANRADLITETLGRYLFSEQVTLANHERAFAVLALQGPAARAVLSDILGAGTTLSRAGDHISAPLDTLPCRWLNHSLTGDAGVLCLCPAEHAEVAWQHLQQRGRAQGLGLVGWEALNAARIEAGIAWYGMDMDEDNLLPETGLEAVAVSETKGCYLGQEVMARMATYGSANKKLMGLLCETDHVPASGDRIVRQGEDAGWVTSACRSPLLERPIGMGYVKRGSYEAGTAVDIVHEGLRISATVAARPLVPRP